MVDARAGRAYFPALTGLRGVAALWVVVVHLWSLNGAPALRVGGLDLTTLASSGFMGVDLFFVLSGFLLGLPFLRWARGEGRFPRLGQFYKRRALRVLPAYYAQLLILIAGGWLLAGQAPIGFPQFLGYLSMEFVFIASAMPLLNNVWWSLPVEWNFYLVLPLVGLLFGRLRWWVIGIGVFILVVAARLYFHELLLQRRTIGPVSYAMIIQLPGRLDEFVCGMIAAWFHLRRRAPTQRGDLIAMLAGVAGVALLLVLLRGKPDIFSAVDVPFIFFFASLAGISLGLIVYASASALPLAQRLFSGRVLAFFGTISYSLYLWHNVLFRGAEVLGLAPAAKAAGLPGHLLLSAGALAAAVLTGWVFYHLTERPFLITAPAAQRGHGALAAWVRSRKAALRGARGSGQQQGEHEDAEHGARQGDLRQRAEKQPDPGGQPHVS